MSFSHLGLAPFFFKSLVNYSEPRAIQFAATPAILKVKDVLGIAKTGSGELPLFFADLTATRSSTILKYLEPTVLVILTTCMLADQVALAFRNFLPFSVSWSEFFCCIWRCFD